MKIYRNVIIAICVVVAVFFTVTLCIDDAFLKTVAAGDYPSQEEYSLWKEYSVEVAKNLDKEIITDKEVRASYDIKNNVVIVEIHSLKYGITIETTYLVDYVKNQNGKLEMQINNEDAQHIEYYKNMRNIGTNKVLAFITHVLGYGLCGSFFAFLIFPIFYGIPYCIYRIVQMIKSKKKQN